MIDLNKSLEFFNPSVLHGQPVHIIGCGAIGSHVAESLARLGITNIHLWDDDKVASHNIANQMFNFEDIGKPKVEAVAQMIDRINPGCTVTQHNERAEDGIRFKGYIVLCVDSIIPRQFIVENNKLYDRCLGIFDFRMGLLSGQFYCAMSSVQRQRLLRTMNFTDEEADVNTPKSACNYELSVVYTIKVIIGVGISLMVKSWQGQPVPMTTLIDVENLSITTL